MQRKGFVHVVLKGFSILESQKKYFHVWELTQFAMTSGHSILKITNKLYLLFCSPDEQLECLCCQYTVKCWLLFRWITSIDCPDSTRTFYFILFFIENAHVWNIVPGNMCWNLGAFFYTLKFNITYFNLVMSG